MTRRVKLTVALVLLVGAALLLVGGLFLARAFDHSGETAAQRQDRRISHLEQLDENLSGQLATVTAIDKANEAKLAQLGQTPVILLPPIEPTNRPALAPTPSTTTTTTPCSVVVLARCTLGPLHLP